MTGPYRRFFERLYLPILTFSRKLYCSAMQILLERLRLRISLRSPGTPVPGFITQAIKKAAFRQPYTYLFCFCKLSQVRFQRAAVTCFLQALDRPFLDLADTLFGKIVFLTDLLNGHTVLAVQSEVSVHDLCLAGAQ